MEIVSSARRPRSLVLWAALLLTTSAYATSREVVFLYLGEPGTAAHTGALQGLSEANAQGEFLDLGYRMETQTGDEAPAIEPVAIIAALEPALLNELVDKYPSVAVLNVTERATSLREDCRPSLFHVIPSDAMIADAERQWREKAADSAAKAQAWHKSFRKYAAAQLNTRFREQFGQDMVDDAWAGWAGVRLLADTIARQPGLTGHLLIKELKTNLAFDGQKGVDMSFRETGQLRQPLLLIEADRIVGEAPVRGISDPTNLDSLGVTFCPK